MTDTTGATDLCRMTPEQLLSRVARGDAAALDALYDATAARLYAVCLALLEDRAEAEETLEEAFLAIWRDAASQPASGLEAMAWLGAVACDRAGLRIAMRDAALADEAARGRRAHGPDSRPPSTSRPAGPATASPDRGLAGAVAGKGPARPAGQAGAAHGSADLSGEGAGPVVDGGAFAARAALVRELVPVMPPARARRRIRERLGHVAAPLSEVIDSRIRWWQRPWGVLTAAIALALLVLVGVALLRPGRPDSAAAEAMAATVADTVSAGTPVAPGAAFAGMAPAGATVAAGIPAGIGAGGASTLPAPGAGPARSPR